MEIPIISYVLRLLVLGLIHVFNSISAIRSKKTSATAPVYKGIRPSPPKVVAIVWAEVTVNSCAVRQLADIIRWCKQDNLEDVMLYDPLGALKLRADEFRCELGSNYSIEVGWSRTSFRRRITCDSCRLLKSNAQPQSAAPAARSAAQSGTQPPATAECHPARPCTSWPTAGNMISQGWGFESSVLSPPAGNGTDKVAGDGTDSAASDGTDRTASDDINRAASHGTDQTAGDGTDQPDGDSADQHDGDGTDRAAGKSTDQPDGDSTDRAAGNRTDKAAGDGTDRAAGESADQPDGDSMDRAAGDHTERGAGDGTDRAAGDSTGQPDGDSTDRAAGDGTEQPDGDEGVSGCHSPCCQLRQSNAPSSNGAKSHPEPATAGCSCCQPDGNAAASGINSGLHQWSAESVGEGEGAAPSGECDAVPISAHGGSTPAHEVEGARLAEPHVPQLRHPDGAPANCDVCDGMAAAPSSLLQIESAVNADAQGKQKVSGVLNLDGDTHLSDGSEPPAPAATPKASEAAEANRHRQGVTVRILSAEDGYAPVLVAASTGGICYHCGAIVPLKAPDYREALARLRQQMADVAGPAVLTLPELVLVVGPALTLAGFCPLHVAMSEILHIGPSQKMCSQRVEEAMAKFLRTEQRFGK